MNSRLKLQKILISITLVAILCIQVTTSNPKIYADTPQALIILPVQPTDAIDPLTKSWVIETMTPGSSINREITIKNSFNTEKKLNIKGSDATQSSIGTFVVKEINEENKDLGTWIKVDQDSVIVPANSDLNVKYTITVPSEAKPGEYAGAIVTYAKDDQNSSNIATQAGVRIYITVPGDNTTLKTNLTNFTFSKDKSSSDTLYIDYTFSNLGSVYTKTKGKATLTYPDNTKTDLNVDFDTSPTKSDLLRSLMFSKKPQAGKYILDFSWENSPLIVSNKGNNITDSSDKKDTKYEFNIEKPQLDEILSRGTLIKDEKPANTNSTQDNNMKRIAIAVLSALGVLAVVSLIVLFLKKKNQASNNSQLNEATNSKPENIQAETISTTPKEVSSMVDTNSKPQNKTTDDILDSDYE